MLGVYRFYWSYGRGGDVDGVFVADSEDVHEAVSKRAYAYLGEACGKHSEVCGDLGPGDITLLSDKPDVVDIVNRYGLEIGYNPLSYIRWDCECGASCEEGQAWSESGKPCEECRDSYGWREKEKGPAEAGPSPEEAKAP